MSTKQADVVYDWDLVLLFPIVTTGECNRRNFVNKMVGYREAIVDGVVEPFIDEAQRFLHSDRCYIDMRGNINPKLAKLASAIANTREESVRQSLRVKQLQEKKRVLTEEYISFTGSDEPCPAKVFSFLIISVVVRRLQQACGLTCQMKYTADKDEVILCLRADATDLRMEADRQNYRLQLRNQPFECVAHDTINEVDAATMFQKRDPDALAKCRAMLQTQCDGVAKPQLDPGLYRNGWHPAMLSYISKLGHMEDSKNFRTRSSVYIAPYCDYQLGDDKKHMLPLFRHTLDRLGDPTEFREIDRIRLVTSIVGHHINIESLKTQKLLIDCFCLHDYQQLQTLRDEWVFNKKLHPFPGGQKQPLAMIREYFGEKIGLYFAWLEHYTKSLVIPAVAGFLFFLASAFLSGTAKGVVLAGFGCFVSVWATWMTEAWKRKNAAINLWWGTADFEQDETARPEFRGSMRYSRVTDQPEIQQSSPKESRRKIAIALTVVILLILGAIGVTSFCFYLKNWLADPKMLGEPIGTGAAGLINATWIAVGNSLYRNIAVKLTNWENHRTNTQWDRYLVTKTFLFRFVNSYASFFYVAFLKFQLEGRCGTRLKPKTCMEELSKLIPMIFVSQMIVGNTVECMSPFMKFKMRTRAEQMKMKKQGLSAEEVDPMVLYEIPELECKKEEYKPALYSFDDYSEMVLQYGYVILFVSAFPLAPVFALLNNTLELHIDAFKLTCVFRRPWPFAAASIGQWSMFMDLLSSVSVITNLMIIIFTSGKCHLWCSDVLRMATDPCPF